LQPLKLNRHSKSKDRTLNIKKLKLIYFSATGTTRKILEGIAQGLEINEVEHIDLTLPASISKRLETCADELVIIGAPVYAGRLPADAVLRFKQLKAAQTPAVLIAVYGNREFDDALIEVKKLAVELGFIPLAAGAFIGEHSFSTTAIPIAHGRPDDRDHKKAVGFGKEIKTKIVALDSLDCKIDLEVPGHFPYESPGSKAMPFSPVTNQDACTFCGTCVKSCPTAAITIDTHVATETEKCIRCSACIKNCPVEVRTWQESKMETITAWLKENYSDRKEPQLFLNR
jgi:ferredoxin/flavodoxin